VNRRAVGPLGIVSALPEELSALLSLVEAAHTSNVAGRQLHQGRLHGHEVVLVLCGIGKVAAALTTTLLIERMGVRSLLFTGVAGGLGADVRVGDVVVARTLLQHDMDASPLFPRHQIPDLRLDELPADTRLSQALCQAARTVVQRPPAAVASFGLGAPRVHEGLVISGDRFVSTSAESAALRERLPQALAVEMEGAAMAQVCTAYGVPCAVLRTVSDRADDQAHVDFPRFLAEVASPMSREIVSVALQGLQKG
jgi:adenosylhomocysteine nucleosidase